MEAKEAARKITGRTNESISLEVEARTGQNEKY
jgi:hypothetical protein